MFVVFWLWPIVQSFLLSFQSWDGLRAARYVGLDNYRQLLFTDSVFITALKNTLLSWFVYEIILLFIAIALGFVLNSRNRFARGPFRFICFLPVTMSTAVVALVFTLIYSPNNGVLMNIVRSLRLPWQINWLGDPNVALWSIVAVRIWRAAGFYAILILAGLQNVSSDQLDAARVDGASPWQTTWYVTLPALKPIIAYLSVVSSVWALQIFEEPWIMTGGGPMGSTVTVLMHLYRNTFQYFKLGYGAAISYVLTLIILILAALQLRLMRSER